MKLLVINGSNLEFSGNQGKRNLRDAELSESCGYDTG